MVFLVEELTSGSARIEHCVAIRQYQPDVFGSPQRGQTSQVRSQYSHKIIYACSQLLLKKVVLLLAFAMVKREMGRFKPATPAMSQRPMIHVSAFVLP